MTAKPELHGAHFCWAKTEDEFHELRALGWDYAEQKVTHHSFHACLLRWHGEGEPVTVKP